jgi:hypothetical protein
MFSGISKKQEIIRENRQNEQPRTRAHQRNRFPLAVPPDPPDRLQVLPNGNQRYAMNNHRFTLLFKIAF